MTIQTLQVGPIMTNCYLLCDEDAKVCALIDPGDDAARVEQLVRQSGCALKYILLTHGHFDHVGAVRQLAADTGCAVYLCAEDLTMPTQLTAGPLYYTNTYAEGSKLHLAGLDISVLHTPGHTPGSVCLGLGNDLFCGDTLFAGSCGRTDLPGGSMGAMRASLKRLAAIPDNLTLHPGHGPGSTLDEERMYNPYL